VARARVAEDSEGLPEADRLEGFPHPRETPDLFGQDGCERVLLEAFASGRMHHAWLLAGRQGVGKATLAYRLAKHVLASPNERQLGNGLAVSPHTAAARQVTALSHPGLLVLRRPVDPRTRRFAMSIPVDEVRRLKSFLGLTGGDAAWRVVIVDSADELNSNAANALLKSLEEPPLRALFLLISREPNSILPTIRSRCRRLDCAPLRAVELQRAAGAALAAAGLEVPQAAAWDQLERLARGSVRGALQLAGSGGLELHQRLAALFATLPRLDWTAVHALADQLGDRGSEQRFEAFYELLLDYLAGLVRAAATGGGEPAIVALAQRLIAEGGLPDWAALWQSVLTERNEAVRLNLDRKALLLGAFARLAALAHG
jgi:DNA polymerase-3 subunit delta'